MGEPCARFIGNATKPATWTKNDLTEAAEY